MQKWLPEKNHCQALSYLNCIMFIAYISIYNEYQYIQNIDKKINKYQIDNNLISMAPLEKLQTPQSENNELPLNF